MRKEAHTVPRTNPAVPPMLDSIENHANTLLHFCFGLVSMISRLRGVETAVVTNENKAYSVVTAYRVCANRNRKIIAAVAT